MHRSVLLLLISVLVLSAASAIPASQEENWQPELSAESVLKVDSAEDLKPPDSYSEEQTDKSYDTDASSSDLLSFEEGNHSENESGEQINLRRRRSVEQEKYRNLELLATICPKKDFKDLEENPLISVKIEIEDMYAICAQLKDRHTQRRR
ncbi:uncharacterized protein LOC110179006 [Drosophila serrata]|uniref:uncharacterized protein LOC110179006 n=1 Tax=Drosophila serrata TaxID=7274 RepID=UPI000A1CF442|nr:uncharacterized protein LOC110179006 [Drosophila serrata]